MAQWSDPNEDARRVREWQTERDAAMALVRRERPFLMGYDALVEADAILDLLHDHGYRIVRETNR